jgi:hypothetical protein
MTQPPDLQVRHPPDNVTWFGWWLVPASPDPKWLAIASAPDGAWIEATIEGDIVVTIPRPRGSTPAVKSKPEPVDGHEIVLYAETWDGGRTVLCDLFLDGRSITTGEPVSAIGQRMALAEARIPERRPILSGWRGAAIVGVFFTLIVSKFVLSDANDALGGALGLAVMLGLDVGLGRLYLLSFEILKSREWEQPVSGLAALAITLGVSLLMAPAFLIAVLLARLV